MSNLPRLDPQREALRQHVLTHSLKTGNFTLKSGRASSWFLDTKQTACRPDGILLVAAGTSIFEAVEVVREFGAIPAFISVIVDRGGTCAEMARNAGVPYVPMLTAPDLGYEFGS